MFGTSTIPGVEAMRPTLLPGCETSHSAPGGVVSTKISTVSGAEYPQAVRGAAHARIAVNNLLTWQPLSRSRLRQRRASVMRNFGRWEVPFARAPRKFADKIRLRPNLDENHLAASAQTPTEDSPGRDRPAVFSVSDGGHGGQRCV